MLHRFFRFVTQRLLTFLCILLLGGLLAGGWFFYQGRQLYRSAASSYPVASMYDTICARGSYTSYDALPQIYINAVICTEDERVDECIGIISQCCKQRTEIVPGTATLGLGIESALPMEVTVGGATVMVTNVERFEKL